MTSQDWLRQAVSLHQAGRLAEAERLYERVLSADPGNFAAQYQQALLLYQLQRPLEATRAVEAALNLSPGSREALMLHGALMLGARQHDRALASISHIISRQPRDADALHNRGMILADLHRFEEAVACYDKVLEIRPTVEAWISRGAALLALRRLGDALASFENALALRPGHAGALCYRGNALMELKRYTDAISAFDGALASSPDVFDAWSNRGLAFHELGRFAEALASYDRAVAIRPGHAGAWTNRGKVLYSLDRFDEALASCDKALVADSGDEEAWRVRALTFRVLHRFEEALFCVDKALALRAEFAPAMFLRGWLLCELNRVTEGLAVIRGEAERKLQGEDGGDPSKAEHKLRHDTEQWAFLTARGVPSERGVFHLEKGDALDEPAVNRGNVDSAAAQWEMNRPRIAVIDNFLTGEALEKLRHFCWGSSVWRTAYAGGYLGAMPERGFACPLLAQIAEELRDGFPSIIGDNPLRMLWGFKYDSRLQGIGIHADQAAVNVNFWITPDEANRNPDSGGLIIWDVAAPPDWDIKKYNGDEAAVRSFLEQSGAKPVTVPYRANRAVIFDSDLFHETDEIDFKDGYLNRRINVTMLYGRRTYHGR